METVKNKTNTRLSYQAVFPDTIKCSCGGTGRWAFEMMESQVDEAYVCELHENEKDSFWPHDAIAVAIYFCKDCGKCLAEYNQG